MTKQAYKIYQNTLNEIRAAGTYKDERVITTPQGAKIDTTKTKGVLNLCANNYLGLADNAALIAAAKASDSTTALMSFTTKSDLRYFLGAVSALVSS